MSMSLLAVVVDCHDPGSLATWWAEVLGRSVSERNTDEYEVSDPSLSGTPLYFMKVPEPRLTKNRLHIDITTDGPLAEAVAALVAVGGRLLEIRQDPASLANPDAWAVMTDPEGNEFCLLETDSVTGMM